MKNKLPFKFFQPSFCAGLIDDPLLLIRFRSRNCNILVDCGQLNHLAKRTLKSVRALFVSHTHMDHFIGFDTFVRNVLVSDRTIDLFGPRGIAERVENRLKGYDWNLTEAHYCDFRIHEITPHEIHRYRLSGSQGFRLLFESKIDREQRTIYENSVINVEAETCDHKIPVLIFKFTEKPVFEVDEAAIYARGFQTGAWVNQLKEWFQRRASDRKIDEITVPVLNSLSSERLEPQALYDSIKKQSETLSIGYITDVGFTANNIETIQRLMQNITLLVCECTYLKENRSKARISYHLCTDDVNQLLDMLKPAFFLPMHLSKTYLYHSREFYQQLRLPDNCRLIKLAERITPPPQLPKEIEFDGMED